MRSWRESPRPPISLHGDTITPPLSAPEPTNPSRRCHRESADALARFLVFPGALCGSRRMDGALDRAKIRRPDPKRIGPPFGQPFFDFIKLFGKAVPRRSGLDGALMRAWPLVAVAAAAGAVGLFPVLTRQSGFQADPILLLALMEIPPICLIAAGFTRVRSSARSALRAKLCPWSLQPGLPAAAVSIAVTGPLSGSTAAAVPVTPWRYLGLFAILLCLPARLHVNPFSLPNAEQEIYSGPMTEYGGSELALWQLSHGLEWIAGVGLVAALAVPSWRRHGLPWRASWPSGSCWCSLSRWSPAPLPASRSTLRCASIGNARSSSRCWCSLRRS